MTRPISLLVALLLPLAAWADEASDRRRAISDAERLVKDMARALSGLARDSGSRGVDEALRYNDRLESKLRDLDRVEGNDSKAREMTSRWPRHVDDFERVERPLERLKKGQRSLKNLAKNCKGFERDLTRAAEQALKSGKRDAARTLRSKAKDLGRKAERTIDDAKRGKSDMERARSDAKRFSGSSGPWRDVKRNVHRAADKMFEDWKRDFEAGRRACEAVKKGERHSKIEKALDQLAKAEKNRALRDASITKAEGALQKVARAAKDIAGARDAREIKKAREALKGVGRPLRDLEKVKGDHRRARALVEAWPKAIKGMGGALNALEKMKTRQYALDDLPGRCADREKALVAQAKAAQAKPAAESHAELLKGAKEAAKIAKETLDRAKDGHKAIENGKRAVERFDGRDDWQPISRSLQGAAKSIVEHHERSEAAVKKACERLAKGPKHPDVEKASAQIRKILERVDRLFERLDADVKGLTDHIKQAGKAKDARPVERAQSAVKSIEGELKRLKGDVDPRAKARATAWLKGFDRLKAALEGLAALKQTQGQLGDAAATCRAAEKDLEKTAKAVAKSTDLARVQLTAKAHGKAAEASLSRGEKLANAIDRAADKAKGYSAGDAPWRGVAGALKSAASSASSAFGKAHAEVKSACTSVAQGARHPAVKDASKTFGRLILAAEKAARGAAQDAERACAPLKGLIAKREKREKALMVMVKAATKETDDDPDPNAAKTLEALDWSVRSVNEEIGKVAAKCEAAMGAYAEADTAAEALYDR